MTLWPDLATAANDLNVAGGSDPLLKLNILNTFAVVRCNGDDSMTLDTSLAVSNFTYIAVAKTVLSTNQQTLICGNSGSLQIRFNALKINVLKCATADMGSNTTTLTVNTFYTIGVTYDGSTLKFYINGVADGSVSVSQTFTANLLGAFVNFANSAETMNGDLPAHFFWSSVLNESTYLLNGGSGITDGLRSKYAHY